MKIALDTTTNVATNAGERCPAGKARVLVRGLAASMEASAQRLNAIAAERAATMATMIHTSWRSEGNPPAASMAPQSANGRAKMECSHLIISSVTRRLCRTGTESIVMQDLGSQLDCVRCLVILSEAKDLCCLLYTSDAADDLTRVDLGGRRIIK